jgi:hypothetical protein
MKNDSIQTFLQGLTPTDSTDYSLWKVTKKIKQTTKFSPPLQTLDKKQCWKSSHLHRTLGTSLSTHSLRKYPWRRRRRPYSAPGNPLPARTTNQTKAVTHSNTGHARLHQQPWHYNTTKKQQKYTPLPRKRETGSNPNTAKSCRRPTLTHQAITHLTPLHGRDSLEPKVPMVLPKLKTLTGKY